MPPKSGYRVLLCGRQVTLPASQFSGDGCSGGQTPWVRCQEIRANEASLIWYTHSSVWDLRPYAEHSSIAALRHLPISLVSLESIRSASEPRPCGYMMPWSKPPGTVQDQMICPPFFTVNPKRGGWLSCAWRIGQHCTTHIYMARDNLPHAKSAPIGALFCATMPQRHPHIGDISICYPFSQFFDIATVPAPGALAQ